MKLTTENLVILDIDSTSKNEVIEILAHRIVDERFAQNYDEYLEALYKREEIAPTSVGYNIGLPHGKSKTVKEPVVAFARLKNPVLWNLEENEYVNMVFMLAIPDENKGDEHIGVLVALSRKILDDNFRDSLKKLDSITKIVELINN